jgi:hypothetical protein
MGPGRAPGRMRLGEMLETVLRVAVEADDRRSVDCRRFRWLEVAEAVDRFWWGAIV